MPDASSVIHTITEDVPTGWVLDNVVCEEANGIIITPVENGFQAECTIQAGLAETACTFFNVRALNS